MMRNVRSLPSAGHLPILALLITASIVIAAIGRNPENNFLAGALSKVFIPFTSLSAKLMHLSYVYEENRLLRGRLMELARENMELREAVHETERLRELIGFKESMSAEVRSARVVGEIDERMGGGLIIDRGRESGIERDMVVVSPSGLVGRTIRVSDGFSIVKRIVDPGNRVSAELQRTRAHGILRTRGRGELVMEWVPPDAEVTKGDTVISSGLGSVVPRGILIGTVSKIEMRPDKFSLVLGIEPSVEFNSLEEVFVVLTEPSGYKLLLKELSKENAY